MKRYIIPTILLAFIVITILYPRNTKEHIVENTTKGSQRMDFKYVEMELRTIQEVKAQFGIIYSLTPETKQFLLNNGLEEIVIEYDEASTTKRTWLTPGRD